MKSDQTRRYRNRLLRWYCSNQRHFFWRTEPISPYKVLVCEMLLRKTRADAVEPVADMLLRRYPNPQKLASARRSSLETMLRPLGLFRVRAMALRKTAKTIVREHGGRVPRTEDALICLPHLGRYGVNAVLCFAYGQRRPIVDVNVVRTFGRQFGFKKPVEIHKADKIWDFAEQLLPRVRFKEFNWALLDLGALVCKPARPRCSVCPVSFYCKAFRRGLVP